MYLLKLAAILFYGIGRLFGSMNKNKPPVKEYIKNIPYKGNKKKKNSLDIVLPEGDGKHPVVILVHGGGMLGGSKESYKGIAMNYANNGYLVFNVNYRLCPKNKFPSMYQDVADAIHWAYNNAAKYNGDNSKIILAGDSAGGNIISWYSTAFDNRELFSKANVENVIPVKPKCLLLYYAGFDFTNLLDTESKFAKIMAKAFIGKDKSKYEEVVRITSPVRHVTPNFPPSFITVAENDILFEDARKMVRKLVDNGVSHKTLYFMADEYPKTRHGFFSFDTKEEAKTAWKYTYEFLNEYVK